MRDWLSHWLCQWLWCLFKYWLHLWHRLLWSRCEPNWLLLRGFLSKQWSSGWLLLRLALWHGNWSWLLHLLSLWLWLLLLWSNSLGLIYWLSRWSWDLLSLWLWLWLKLKGWSHNWLFSLLL